MNSVPSSKTILSIMPVGILASHAFHLKSVLKHNRAFTSCEVPTRRKKPAQRDTTPQFDPPSESHIKLCTDVRPRDLTKGWCFGCSPELCDVLLDKDKSHGVSALHFEINFNWTSLAVIIANRSGNIIELRQPRQDTDYVKQGEKRALLGEPGTLSITAGKLKFLIEIPDREDPDAYKQNLRAYYEAFAKAIPSLTKLDIQQHKNPTPAIELHRYFEEALLGHGSYGRVYSGIDGITGDLVALKSFYDRIADDTIKREVDALKRLRHENIVSFIDYMPDSRLLVMEYAVHGTLEACKHISHFQLYRLAKQMTSALTYLHEERITHRDVKPANILIVAKDPYFDFKLADFSDWGDSSDLTTFRGTPMYQAPEIQLGSTYSDAVDIWSLGIVLIERWYDWYPDFVYHLGINRDTFLPDTLRNTEAPDRRPKLREDLIWTVETRNALAQFVLIGLKKSENAITNLFLGMFEESPSKRWPAARCSTYLQLPEVQNLPQFDSTASGTHIDMLGQGGASERPSKRVKLLGEKAPTDPTDETMADVHFVPSRKEISASGLWQASAKRKWPMQAICSPYKITRKTKKQQFISYDDGLDLAKRLELRDSSLEILRSWTQLGMTRPPGTLQIQVERLEDIPETHKIVHIIPERFIINASNILQCAGKGSAAILPFLQRNNFTPQKIYRTSMSGAYVEYPEGLRLCDLVGIPTDKVQSAMDSGWLGPLLEIQGKKATKVGRARTRYSDRLGRIDERTEAAEKK